MTTTVTIKTVSWPVEVTIVDDVPSKGVVETKSKVPPNTQVQQYVTQTRSLVIKELPLEGAE